MVFSFSLLNFFKCKCFSTTKIWTNKRGLNISNNLVRFKSNTILRRFIFIQFRLIETAKTATIKVYLKVQAIRLETHFLNSHLRPSGWPQLRSMYRLQKKLSDMCTISYLIFFVVFSTSMCIFINVCICTCWCDFF